MKSTKVSLVMTKRSDSTLDELESALRSKTAAPREDSWRVTASVALDPDPFAGTAHRDVVPAGIDGVLSWELDEPAQEDRLEAVVGEAAERLSGVIDLGRCGLICGVEHAVIEGDGPLHVGFALRRRPTMSHEEFSDYWLNSHGRMAREAPRRKTGTGYRQLHADPGVSRTVGAAVGIGTWEYDGIVSSDHVAAERMKKIFSHPAVAETALADERVFIDHGRSAIGLLRKLS